MSINLPWTTITRVRISVFHQITFSFLKEPYINPLEKDL